MDKVPRIKVSQKRYSVRKFIYSLFCNEVDETNNTRSFFMTCNNIKCVNIKHIIYEENKRGLYLKDLGWDNDHLDMKELQQCWYLQNILSKGERDGECLLWTNYTTEEGYGYTNYPPVSKKTAIHRMRWILEHGEIPKELQIRHKCKNKNCFEISHLDLGTALENSSDKLRDGTILYGEQHPCAKMSDQLAQSILDSKGEGTAQERSEKYNVNKHTIKSIDGGISWKHLKRKCENTKEIPCKKLKMEYLKPTKNDYEKVWKRLQKTAKRDENTNCLFLPLLKDPNTTSIGGAHRCAHVVIWEFFEGNCEKVSDEIKISRSCDNINCIEPTHLCSRTPEQICQVRREKGNTRGMDSELAKKIWDAKDTATKREIADKFDVSFSCVEAIHRQRTHKYLHVQMKNDWTNYGNC